MSNEPYRFLSYEKITVNVTTRGEPEKVLLRFSPALEAMMFQDKKGHYYSYSEEIGYEVLFPIHFIKTATNKYKIEYILPLASSTINWQNQRQLPSYEVKVGLEKAGRTVWETYGDEVGEVKIDITGNIFDLQYNQPRSKTKK